ncbi:STAS domain-containing protein [Streptosporangium sp. NPDC050855]|uniref:STAS domain-containing protein n=1 Tax=Streptosporangium sp. NPDC050855 TaxID=3366194 RepID=UPI0037B31E5A
MNERHRQELRVRVTHHGHCSVLEIGGHLDFITGPTLVDHVEAVWERSPGPRLVMEVSGLTFYDSTALAVLANTHHRVLATATGRLVFVGMPPGLRHLLLRTGLLPHFALRDSVDEAVADLLPTA